MTISIDNVAYATTMFTLLLTAVVVLSMRRSRTKDFFPVSTTQELKGVAMLGVIFSHIGYFLVTDHQFLFPLSVLAGVSVNLFLFLSGYGLTLSSLRKKETVRQFYTNRVLRLMIPFWLVGAALVALDYFVHGITYPWHTLLPAAIGVFTTADLYHDIDSPLWYFTMILFYYVLFPLLFSRKRPWLTAVLLFAASGAVLLTRPPALAGVIGLYAVHIVAFPLGVLTGWLRTNARVAQTALVRTWDTLLHNARGVRGSVYYYGTAALLMWFIGYTALHSGVGSGALVEQTVSILTMGAVLLLFALKNVESRFLYLVGLYSYELYLLHWPIMYRYNFLYGYVPAWIATALYLGLFLALGWVIQQVSNRVYARLRGART